MYVERDPLVCCHLNVANSPVKQRLTQKIIEKKAGGGSTV